MFKRPSVISKASFSFARAIISFAFIGVFLTLGGLFAPVVRHAGAEIAIPSPASERPESELARLVAPDASQGAEFGTSLDVDDGTLVVGAPFSRDGSGVPMGAAYVYVKQGSDWVFQAKLDPPAGSSLNSNFGISVAISGNTIVVGASRNNVGPVTGKGSAWVFVRSGSVWSLQQQLTGLEAANGSQFGFSVDISGDTVAVGARQDGKGAVRWGSAYVFVRSGSTWTQQARLTDVDGNSNDDFGHSITVGGDTVIVGARFGDMDGLGATGVACVFTRSGGSWSLQARLAPSDGNGEDRFGSSMTMTGDTVFIGAVEGGSGQLLGKGAVYNFTRNAGVWTQAQRIDPVFFSAASEFGSSVAISGERLIVGDSNFAIGNSNRGMAALYIKNGATWQFQNKLSAAQNTLSDRLGTGVAIQGNIFFAGAPGFDIAGENNFGAVYMFSQAPFAPDLQTANDTGVSNSDNITRIQNLTFDVGGITPGASVELLRDDVVVDSEVVAGSSAVLTDTTPPNGIFRYASRQVIGGETSAPSEPLDVTVDTTVPAVFLNQGAGQQDPTMFASITFRVVFSEVVTPLGPGGVSLAGSTANVSNAVIVVNNLSTVQSDVIVTDIISNGHVVMASIPAGGVTDIAGNPSILSAGADNTVTLDNVRPSVTVEQAAGQADPTTALPVNYTVTFSEPVNNFEASDLNFNASTGGIPNPTRTITGGPLVYNVELTNFTSNGGVVRMGLNGGVTDAIGNQIFPSTSVDNAVTLDNVRPTVTVNQVAGQADPASSQPINFRAFFSENVTGLGPGDFSLIGSTADVSHALITVSGSNRDYTISVRNVISSGNVVLTLPAGGAVDSLGNQNVASTSTDNIVALNVPSFATITGRVANEFGRGLGLVRIVAILPGGETRYTQTNPFGYYRIVNAPTGSVTLTFTRKNMQSFSETFFLVQNVSGYDITLTYPQNLQIESP